jgi:hypothetical protein
LPAVVRLGGGVRGALAELRAGDRGRPEAVSAIEPWDDEDEDSWGLDPEDRDDAPGDAYGESGGEAWGVEREDDDELGEAGEDDSTWGFMFRRPEEEHAGGSAFDRTDELASEEGWGEAVDLGESAEEERGSWVRHEDGTWAFHPDDDEEDDSEADDMAEEGDVDLVRDADEDDTDDGDDQGHDGETRDDGGDEGVGLGDEDVCVSCGGELEDGGNGENWCPKCGSV